MGSEVCAEDLTDAVNSFENPTLRSILAANLNGTVYEIDANQTSTKGEIQCDTGYVSSGVDCGKSCWYFYRKNCPRKSALLCTVVGWPFITILVLILCLILQKDSNNCKIAAYNTCIRIDRPSPNPS